MAVAPLFVASTSDLKSALRLSGVNQTDGLRIIDHAIEETRVFLYSRLGQSTITTLLAASLVDNPSSDAEYKRKLAATVETKKVKSILLRSMNVLFREGNSEQLSWNEDGFRDIGPESAEKEIQRLLTEIEIGISDLVEGTLDASDTNKVAILAPDEGKFLFNTLD